MSEVKAEKIPVGYKQTEVGVIPEDWLINKIGNLISITTGKKNTQDKITDGKYAFFVRSQQIEKINSFSYDGEGVLTAGDGVGTGKIFHYIRGKFDYHQRVYLMYNFSDELDGYYFYLFFSSHFYDRIMSMTAKSSVDSVRREMITEMPIIVPPKEEQTAIANALSDVDALITEQEKLITKKQAIKTATMQQLLTGRTRLPQFALREDGTKKGYKPSELGEIPEDWDIFSFGQNFAIYAGGDVPRDALSKIKTDKYQYPIFANAVQKKGLYGYTSYKRSKPGSLTITARGYLGYAVYRKEWFFPIVRLLVLEPTGALNPIYTTYFINERIEFPIESTGVPQLTAPQVTKYSVAASNNIEEQTAIATILSDMDAEIEALEQQLDKTRQIKQGMMQELLTGKTRLV